MYAAERKRSNLKRNLGSLDEWLKNLRTKVEVSELNQVNFQRTLQLLNKTNQMNLTTRRFTESELTQWVESANHKLWTFRVSDKFGDSGLTGIISIEVKDKTGGIVDFVLSCRVMGRRVEETMLYTVIQYARSMGLEQVYAIYIPTPKNKPCLEFWRRSGFSHDESDNRFIWQVSKEYALPDCIHLDKSI
jgi:FkbH-like protein